MDNCVDEFDYGVFAESGWLVAVFRLPTPADDFVNMANASKNYNEKYYVEKIKTKTIPSYFVNIDEDI